MAKNKKAKIDNHKLKDYSTIVSEITNSLTKQGKNNYTDYLNRISKER